MAVEIGDEEATRLPTVRGRPRMVRPGTEQDTIPAGALRLHPDAVTRPDVMSLDGPGVRMTFAR
jgi:hypothetical protein